jgi:hypothetical protein
MSFVSARDFWSVTKNFPPVLISWLSYNIHRILILYDLRKTNSLRVPKVKTTTYGQKSWRFTAAKLWNNLPDELRQTRDIVTFKNLLANIKVL